MIKKVKPNLYIADKNDLCDPDILFIREDENNLHHICQREKGKWGTEEYLVGKVYFDPLEGEYFCSSRNCNSKFNIEDVWSDLEGGTGSEGRC